MSSISKFLLSRRTCVGTLIGTGLSHGGAVCSNKGALIKGCTPFLLVFIKQRNESSVIPEYGYKVKRNETEENQKGTH